MDPILSSGGATPASAPGDLIKDATIETFMEDVVQASMQRPILVDFWADWCGPCKQLMPALEAAVQDAGGAVGLVKVNADQNQTLCAQLQVQSLPTVLAFFQGQPIDGFQGALPGSHLKQFIDGVIQKTGASAGVPEDPLAGALEEAETLVAADQIDMAAQLFSRILEVKPDELAARVGLADVQLRLGQADSAASLMDGLDTDSLEPAELKAKAERINASLELASLGDASADIAGLQARIDEDPGDHAARIALAKGLVGRGDMTGAAESLLASIMRDRDYEKGEARVFLLKLFDAAGATDPFTLKYRRRLSSILFS